MDGTTTTEAGRSDRALVGNRAPDFCRPTSDSQCCFRSEPAVRHPSSEARGPSSYCPPASAVMASGRLNSIINSVPDGSTASLLNPTSVTPSFVPDKLGDYVVQLIVNDGTVDSQPATVTVTTENTAPVANAGPARTVQLGASVDLDGSSSFDADGHSLTYHWSLTPPAGSSAALVNADTQTPSFIADVAGNYVAQLIVNDGFVNSAPATVVISTINSVPVADLGPGQKVPTGTAVHLDGSASRDADGDPLTYRWAITVKPEGSTATLSDTTAQKPTFVPDVEGTYVIQLIVNDGTVDSAPGTVMVLVENPNEVAA